MARILVVDDEPHLRFILQNQLEDEGYEVALAEDGFGAIAWLQRETPDLVILDVMMPRMDGIDVLRWMKKNYRTAAVPVIFLTARSDREARLSGLHAGAIDYLTKPYEKSELVARIRNMLEFRQLQRQASPLTGLPGNQAIQDALARRISHGESFSFLHLDIDQFKSFNDFYGYHRGDQVICRTSGIICDALADVCGGQGFVGHVGGDDFVLLTDVAHGEMVAHEIVRRFDAAVPSFYDDADRDRGYIEIANRRGRVERFPLITITVAVVCDEGGHFEHVGSLGAAITELKRHGKSRRGSIVVPERRGGYERAVGDAWA